MDLATKTTKDNWGLVPIREDDGQDTFSSDDVINAYLKGKSDQVSQDQRTLIEKLEHNLSKAKEYSENLFDNINSSGFKCEALRLKINDIYHFKTIFLIDEDDFISDEFLKIYKTSIELKKKVNNNPNFEYTTIFTPNSKNISIKSMLADGYVLTYGIH